MTAMTELVSVKYQEKQGQALEKEEPCLIHALPLIGAFL